MLDLNKILSRLIYKYIQHTLVVLGNSYNTSYSYHVTRNTTIYYETKVKTLSNSNILRNNPKLLQ